MEAQIASASSELLPGLTYKLPSAADYISGRRSASFFPQGGNSYGVNGVRVIRFELSDQMAYLDPHTTHLSFTVTNNAADADMTLRSHNPLVMFSRLRIHMAGTLVEDISYYGRTCAMIDKFTPAQRRWTKEAMQGFGRDLATHGDGLYAINENAKIILRNGGSYKVCCPIYSGLFSQHLLIPLKHAPITIELELSTNVGGYSAAGSSTDFTISDVRVLADVLHLDGAIEEKVSKALASGSGLPLSFSSWSTTMNVISPSNANGSFAMEVSKSLSRVKGVFASMSSVADDGQNVYDFHHPINAATYNSARDTLEWAYHIGSEKMPDYPVRSVTESAMQLLKALNLTAAEEGLGFDPAYFTSNSFFMALDLEKAAVGPGGGAAFTGRSLKGGESLRLEAKGINTDAGSVPIRCFIALNFEVLVRIQLEGTQVFE